MVVYEIKILFLKIINYWYLSDIAHQFKVDKSYVVRHICKLVAIPKQTHYEETN